MENELNSGDSTTEEREAFDPNSLVGTFIVAVVLCLVCSTVVSLAAVGLRPIQDKNEENKRKRNVLIAAGIWDQEKNTDADIKSLFESIEIVAVNLPGRAADAPPGGSLNTAIDVNTYNQLKASKDPAQSIDIASKDADGEANEDVAGISRREKVSLVYLVNDEQGALKTIVLPVYGKGLWSTMYGFLALESDARTVRGITFYKDGETPGLGGEINNPKWKAQWPGKVIVDGSGKPELEITKPGNASRPYQIDGLSGASITSGGVEKTIHYWLGEDGFGPYLAKLQTQPENSN